MKLNYVLLLALMGLIYAVIVNFFPDFPLSLDLLTSFALYVLAKLGVEVFGAPLRRVLKLQ